MSGCQLSQRVEVANHSRRGGPSTRAKLLMPYVCAKLMSDLREMLFIMTKQVPVGDFHQVKSLVGLLTFAPAGAVRWRGRFVA